MLQESKRKPMQQLFHFRSPSGSTGSAAGVARSASPGFATPPEKNRRKIADMATGSANEGSDDDCGNGNYVTTYTCLPPLPEHQP
jgi:hypothetical protein